mmetsp:Transcript_116691/g.371235  ORF Transcript_116691/g.371235 Transcript_116691/m.371235 type:complete len:368 (+) Transcript_116691:59-1162(+)|eukprot:CAMPEP_0203921314 /NCGR_PEP_ID=MMETSP0359-20131031/61465_1 /ASSEMBLY_ACC=CAM_ASM_000338 /TAXON_ID=268821 /ORGANISM="Scrippsiella Hangoei, Strain SHTV-5" /LENGTH=367 /DNA_ID=CAMNT_0050848975 /DNA_START=30 /DNA_END=1133 /DNA_ORIENTATION=-
MAEPTLALQDLQGDWVASRGEAVRVAGREVTINGNPMPGGLKLSPSDASRVTGFGIYRVQAEIASDGQVLWHAGPQEIIWRRAKEGEVKERITRFDSITNTAGIGLAAAANTAGAGFGVNSEREAVVKLNLLIEKWRVGPLLRVRSCDICPDWTNRAQTGLSLDHVHYIATMIAQQGFKSRRRGLTVAQGAHDVPVLVRETADTELGGGAREKWREHVGETPGFPPFLLDGKREFFCSLGNGHFSQALNLFRTEAKGLWIDGNYSVGGDGALREALEEGVESVVLSNKMPVHERKFVSEMLNRASGRTWRVGADGQIDIDGDVPAQSMSMFVALSKVLDAEELSTLVRVKLGVDVDRSGTPITKSRL